jgi:hypothetical protein
MNLIKASYQLPSFPAAFSGSNHQSAIKDKPMPQTLKLKETEELVAIKPKFNV